MPVDKTNRSSRVPQQARGNERKERILDACAAIISEAGVTGLTMQGLSKRASTAIGSLYHFFPTKESVIDGLKYRHAKAFDNKMQTILSISNEQWINCTTEKVMAMFIFPLMEFLENHPENLALIAYDFHKKGAFEPKNFDQIQVLYRHILKLRSPQTDDSTCDMHSLILFSLPIGLIEVANLKPKYRKQILLHYIPRVLSNYLTSIENS
ncbi:TetR/AcrR family transcriptional regulator [Pseudomonas syringae]|uniref:TetR/AcrR family transcriptional regulator n=1 Tax=Pseudomonas syringae TaxID=317 RepID=UPI0009B35297|nr:TetR/AcrR family transcriptional regulator [Pseudomonas syringae]